MQGVLDHLLLHGVSAYDQHMLAGIVNKMVGFVFALQLPQKGGEKIFCHILPGSFYQHYTVVAEINIDLNMLGAFSQILLGDIAGNPAIQHIVHKQRLHHPLVHREVIHTFADGLIQLILIQRLEQVVFHTQLYSFLGEGEFPEGGENDAPYLRIALAHLVKQGDTVQIGHLNVGDHKIYRIGSQNIQRFQTIMGGEDFFNAIGGPIHIILQGVDYFHFVINKKNLVHI